MIEDRIKKTLQPYFNDKAGTPEIIVSPGRFGGYDVLIIWEGFEKIGLSARMDPFIDALQREFGSETFLTVRTLHARTPEEKANEDMLKSLNASDLPRFVTN